MKHAKTSKHGKVGRVIGCIVSALIIIAAIAYLSAFTTENVELSRTSKSDVTQYCKSAPIQLSSTVDSAPLSTASAVLEDVELEPSDVEDAESALNSAEDSSDITYFEDIELLAKLIYLEAGTCSEDCQWLVGSTAVNLAEDRGGLEAVAYDYNTFNVAYQIDSCSPSETSYAVASRILSGDIDYQVYAFRTDMYHEWATPYISIDNVYFSIY